MAEQWEDQDAAQGFQADTTGEELVGLALLGGTSMQPVDHARLVGLIKEAIDLARFGATAVQPVDLEGYQATDAQLVALVQYAIELSKAGASAVQPDVLAADQEAHVESAEPHPLAQATIVGLLQQALDLAGSAARATHGGHAYLAGGSALLPALLIGNAGIYSAATDTLSVAIAGVERLRVTTSGITVYGTVTTVP